MFADGGVHLSQGVRDGVALVRVDGLGGAEVHLNQQYIGQTGRGGKLIVPNLNAWTDNALRVEVDELPMGYSLDVASKTVVPSFRGGGVVDFKVVKLRAVEGRLSYLLGAEQESGQYSSLEVYVDDETTLKTVTGFGGMFYIEDLQPGEYRVRAYKTSKDCIFTINVPESEFPIVSVGDVACEVLP